MMEITFNKHVYQSRDDLNYQRVPTSRFSIINLDPQSNCALKSYGTDGALKLEVNIIVSFLT